MSIFDGVLMTMAGASLPADHPLPLDEQTEAQAAAIPVQVDEGEPFTSSLDINKVFLGGLFFLAIFAACYAAAEIILPIILAFVLMLVLQPVMRLLARLYLPRGVAALLLILVLFAALAVLGTILSGQATNLIQNMPTLIPRLQQRVSLISEPLATFQKFLGRAQSLTQGAAPAALPVAVEGTGLSRYLLNGTRSLVSGLLETMLVLFFLLLSGDTFLRRLVEVLPHFKDKRQAVEISQRIESDIAAYLATVTIMNLVVGVATGTVVALSGLGDPVLWGTVAFLLNYIPVLGPTTGVVIFLILGLLWIDSLWMAVLPALCYLGIHLIEGETITPLLLAHRFTINPVMVIIGVLFWYWMWGVPGAILATPMLAIAKIICDRIQALTAFGHFIEG